MDPSLISLRDAFEDVEYKRSRRDFSLYAILLATSLDREFIVEYLSRFVEIDCLTGQRMLVIGPKLDPERAEGHGAGEAGAEDGGDGDAGLRQSHVHGMAWLLAPDQPGAGSDKSRCADALGDRFLSFLHHQARESYAIARYLGIRADEIPALAIFDDLDAPRDYVVWNLHGMSGDRFVTRLRTLLDDVGERCGWHALEEITRRVTMARAGGAADEVRRLEQERRELERTNDRELDVVRELLPGAELESRSVPAPLNIASALGDRCPHAPKVFVSYSHDSPLHRGRVTELAQRLRADGIDCWIDQFEESPEEGVPRWMQNQMRGADFVVVVCTALYQARFDGREEASQGRGAAFEGQWILQDLFDASTKNRKYIPVLLPGSTRAHVPKMLRGATSYEISADYESLRNRLFDLSETVPQPLGQRIESDWTF